MTDDNLEALIVSAFMADRAPPPQPAAIVAQALRHAQEPPIPARGRPRPAQVRWAAAGLFALVFGFAAGVSSGFGALPSDLDLAFGAPVVEDVNVG